MAQSGLHVPAEAESSFCMFSEVLCDIGDGQSIQENLSTFSSHMKHIIEILGRATEESLVLLDELGSGTDPAEGMGLAVAVLEELCAKRCLFVATTHYPEIKEFATHKPGLLNARMAFDRESLRPLYRLELGAAGESCALYIAGRLGMPRRILNRAQRAAYGETAPQMDIAASGQESSSPAPAAPNRIRREAPKQEANNRSQSFRIGDSVLVYPKKEIGIVYAPANDKGEVGVQVKGSKKLVMHKRLKLMVSAEELYPEDYDFSILFDSVENRKARHIMGKRHQPGNRIVLEDGAEDLPR
jgi:dsDNA-specific endonuclease/ATPase MutS2